MSEIEARGTFRDHIAPFGKLQRFENLTGAGPPDFYYCLTHPKSKARGRGWVEAKFLEEWPHRVTTLVKIPLRQQQLIWAEEWVPAGERLYLFIRAPGTYILLGGEHFGTAYRGLTRKTLQSVALIYEERRSFPTGMFIQELTSSWPHH